MKLANPTVDPSMHILLQRYDQILGYCESVANGLVDSKLLPFLAAAGDGSATTASAVL